ncbi:hypothetical protein D3C80_1864020 [compost metagenome]
MVFRQICSSQNLFTIVVRYRHFGRRDQVIFRIPQLEQIFFKLRQLASTIQTVLIYDIWRQHLLVVMLPAVKIHHEVD